jgi:hypothetical protein
VSTAAVLERTAGLLGRPHTDAVVDLLVEAGWHPDDAREAVRAVLAASYLIASDSEEN